jgi:hypothetical protein
MATAALYGFLSARLGGRPVQAGSLERPHNVTVTGNIHRRDEAIANGANAVLYNDQMGDFKVLYMESDFNVKVKITNTKGTSFELPLAGQANTEKYGVPFMLGDDTSGSGNTVNTIQVFNTSGNTATVTCIVIE